MIRPSRLAMSMDLDELYETVAVCNVANSGDLGGQYLAADCVIFICASSCWPGKRLSTRRRLPSARNAENVCALAVGV
jgi:hypothetical protein